jgi:hypothetical protein
MDDKYRQFCAYLGCMQHVESGHCKEHEGLKCPNCKSNKTPRNLPDGGSACLGCVTCHKCKRPWSQTQEGSTWYKNNYAYCGVCTTKRRLSFSDIEKEIDEEERKLKQRKEDLKKEKEKKQQDFLSNFVALSEPEREKLRTIWKKDDIEHEKRNAKYKRDLDARKQIMEAWATHDAVNPWDGLVDIGNEDFPFCKNRKDFLQCRSMIRRVINSGEGRVWYDGEFLLTTPEGLANFAMELYKERQMLTPLEQEHWIEKESVNVFIDPFENADEFYVCIRNPTEEDKEDLIQLY